MSSNLIRQRQSLNHQGLGFNHSNSQQSHNYDVFPILDIEEIALCLQSCDFSIATPQSIAKPTSVFVITLYKQIIDSFMGLSPDQLIAQQQEQQNRIKNINQKSDTQNLTTTADQSQSYNDISYFNDTETIKILILNKICFKFFQDIGIDNFNIMDLYKPEFNRTKRLLSAVVNYARFREERMNDCYEFLSTTENLLNQLKEKFDESNEIGEQYGKYKNANIDDVNGKIKTHENEIKNLQAKLKELVTLQGKLTNEYEEYKLHKKEALSNLESLGFQEIDLEADRDKLSKYCEMNTDEIDSMISNLQQSLHTQQEVLKSLEFEQKKLIEDIENFTKLFNDLSSILDFIVTDIQESHMKETQFKELQERNQNTRKKLEDILTFNILEKISILEKQIDQQSKNWELFREQQEEKKSDHEQRLSELENDHEETVTKVQKNNDYINRELVNGELRRLTNQIESLKNTHNIQMQQIEDEYLNLQNHLDRYIKEILKNQ